MGGHPHLGDRRAPRTCRHQRQAARNAAKRIVMEDDLKLRVWNYAEFVGHIETLMHLRPWGTLRQHSGGRCTGRDWPSLPAITVHHLGYV